MEKAIRVISVERGYDPRDFTLVSFGGAGGLHACALASSLRISQVLVPQYPGALSALGILLSDVVKDYSRTVMLAPPDAALAAHFTELEKQGREEMKAEGLATSTLRVACSADLRYVGQGYEINVPWTKGPAFLRGFHRAHEARYGYADPLRPVEVVNVRVRLAAPGGYALPRVPKGRQGARGGNGRLAIVKRGRYPVYQRERLQAGDRFAGPAVIAEYSGTTFLPPEFRASVDGAGNLICHESS